MTKRLRDNAQINTSIPSIIAELKVNYEYTDEQIEEIKEEIEHELAKKHPFGVGADKEED